MPRYSVATRLKIQSPALKSGESPGKKKEKKEKRKNSSELFFPIKTQGFPQLSLSFFPFFSPSTSSLLSILYFTLFYSSKQPKMQKSATLLKATSQAASRATAATASTSSASQALRSSKLRMRIRVNCAGIVQTSELAFVKGFHTSSARHLHMSAASRSPSATKKLSAQLPSETFQPQVYSQQGYVSVAGSNASYESSLEKNADHASYSESSFAAGEISGPSNTTFSKDHHSE